MEKDYKVEDLINIVDKEGKNCFELELSKQFKALIKNYYTGIMHSILRTCCGNKYSIEDLKEKLKEKDSYKIIDIRCSRDNIRFDKETVDEVIRLTEKYKLN